MQPTVKASDRHINRAGPECPLSYNLGSPDPTKFFNQTNPRMDTNNLIINRIGDVNHDEFEDYVITDSVATAPGGSGGEGQVWIIFGGPNVNLTNLSNLLSNQGLVLYGPYPSSGLGSAIVGLDFNGDGIGDVAIGANGGSGGSAQGAVYVLLGPVINPDLKNCDGGKCVKLNGVKIGDLFGSCLAGGKDINGDRIADLLVGAPGVQQIFGYFGATGQWPAQFNTTQLIGSNGFFGSVSNIQFGCPLAMGTLQNNSIASFAVANTLGSYSNHFFGGIIYVFNGRNGTWPSQLNFTLDGTDKGFTVYGQKSDNAGSVLSFGGDFDNDGNTDLLIGTGQNHFRLYFVSIPTPLNTPLSLGILNGTMGGMTLQMPNQVMSLDTIDINNDGFRDIALGMPLYTISGPVNSGTLIFILGQSDGISPQLDIATANSSYVILVPGVVRNGELAGNVANVGDINGDGREELGVIQAPTISTNGTAYILLSQPLGCPPPTTTPPAPTTSSPTTTPAPTPPLGAIIGGAVGGAVAVGGVVGTLLLLRHKGIGCFAKEEAKTTGTPNQFFNDI